MNDFFLKNMCYNKYLHWFEKLWVSSPTTPSEKKTGTCYSAMMIIEKITSQRDARNAASSDVRCGRMTTVKILPTSLVQGPSACYSAVGFRLCRPSEECCLNIVNRCVWTRTDNTERTRYHFYDLCGLELMVMVNEINRHV
jgi:hypothetical protein